ncbi:MAG: helix-turn-helix transcriptional regulator [Mycobacteriales bacterium]|nr:helix-turn-helix transcriptional regulator [Mycobacteriales bacterium]
MVRAERTARGWTQQDLADACGLTRQSINNVERRRSDLATSSLLTVLAALSLQLTVTPVYRNGGERQDKELTDGGLDELLALHTKQPPS